MVLDDTFADCEIGSQKIRIGGTMGHAFPFGRTSEEFESSSEYMFLKEMEQTDSPTIVLAHMPDTFIFNGAHNYWSNIDLVVSGHTHGGVIRLPLSVAYIHQCRAYYLNMIMAFICLVIKCRWL